MRTLRLLLEAAAFRLLLRIAQVVPRGALRRAGHLAGTLGYWLDGRHRRIARANLQAAFAGELDPRAARRIARACWSHFGRITFEALAFPRFDRRSIGPEVRFEGLDHLRAAYARGKGVLQFSGHYGHWELAALMQAHLGLPLALVARPLDNPRLEPLLTGLRSLSGNRVVYKRHAVREILREVSRGGSVAILLDQDARRDGVFVPFFGRLASTTPTLALVALRTGAAIVPTRSIPGPGGTYTIVYEPEIAVAASGDRDADVHRITAACTARLEAWVRERPELWLWMHRRWKTRPQGETPEAASRSGGG
jgi:KDO2-lipid IV(A) lauroyltransferase